MLVLVVAITFVLIARGGSLAPYSWAKHNSLVAHAMGGINGQDYTNSLEAWELNYERGYRVFEVDLRVLDDGTIVCSHTQPSELTVGEYEASRTVGGYTPLTMTNLAELMARYPDAWVMTDMKSGGPADHDNLLKALRSAVSSDSTSQSRIIVQAYEEADYRAAHKLGYENIIYTLYRQQIQEWPHSIAFAAENNIRFIGMPKELVTTETVEQARSKQIWVGVYTVNSESERSRYEKMGVTHFYSDYLQP